MTVQSLGGDPIVAVGPRGSGLSGKKQVDIGWLAAGNRGDRKTSPMRELTLASPIDHPGSTAIALVSELLRDELIACREEGLWDIKLA